MKLWKRFTLATAALATCALAMAAPASAQIFFNEIRIDETGTDVNEYVEFRGPASTSLSGYTLIVIGDGAAGCGTIENVIDLSPYSIQADGLFALRVSGGTATLTGFDASIAGSFENSDNLTFFLVTGSTAVSAGDIDADNDGVQDAFPWTTLVDEVALVEFATPACGVPAAGDESVYSTVLVGPDGGFAPGHVYWCPDTNVWAIGPFNPVGGLDTPGSANPSCALPPPVISHELRNVCAPLVGQTATVTDTIVGANSVQLDYSVNGAPQTPIAMSNIGGDAWQATLPAQLVNGTRVSYQVTATNASGTDVGFVWGYFVGTMNIGDLRNVDGNGNEAYRFYGARVTGTVTAGQGTFSAVNTDFWIQDATGGLRVFKFGLPSSSPALGDEVEIAGELDQFNGLLELENSTACGDLEISILGPGSVPTPLMINTCSLGEDSEGYLVRMQFPQIDTTGSNNSNWVGNRSYTIRSCHPNTDVMFVDADTDIDGTPVVALQADITGMSGQFDSNTPFTGNYQIIPRGLSDIIPVFSAGTPDSPVRAKARLLPNAPNPFSTATTIRYDVAAAGEAKGPVPVQIHVYDVAGRKVATLVDEAKAPGSYELSLDASTLGGSPSGIFFYELSIEGKSVATRKLVVSR
jgi:hypothetical protein